MQFDIHVLEGDVSLVDEQWYCHCMEVPACFSLAILLATLQHVCVGDIVDDLTSFNSTTTDTQIWT
jgi:hypothetical protein